MEVALSSLAGAALVGYLIGSISGTRLVAKRFGVTDLKQTIVVLDGTGSETEMHGVSPSALQARRGGRAGIPAALVDITKALVPTLVARLIWPDTPEHVAVAAGVAIGHVYPVYHHFIGGFGISPLLGALLVIDWRAPLAAIAVFALLGLIAGNAYLGIETWPVGLIPWFAWQGDAWTAGFAVLANLLYWWRSRREAVAALASFRHDRRPWRKRVGDFRRYPDYEVPDTS